MQLRSLDPRVAWLWRLHAGLRLLLWWGPIACVVGFGVGSIAGASAGLIIGLALIAFLLMLAIVWPTLEYDHFRFAVREHDLLVQRGVLFRRRSSIPHNRIQHVDTRQGPLERLFGLSRLAVYTASGVSADSSIPGLASEHAEGIRDELAKRGGDDGV